MSYILSSLIKKKVIGWNKQIFSEDDALALCRDQGVRVVFDNISSRGEYTVYKKISFIILRENLNNQWRPWVLWHELAHHFLHYPGHYLFNQSSARKVDFEANFVASVALIPTKLVETMTFGEIVAEYNYPKKLIEIRKQIYDHYKI